MPSKSTRATTPENADERGVVRMALRLVRAKNREAAETAAEDLRYAAESIVAMLDE